MASVWLVISCNTENFEKESKSEETLQSLSKEPPLQDEAKDKEYYMADSARVPQQGAAQKITGTVPKVKEDWDRRIIRTADLTVEVKDHQAFYASLRQKVRDLGGYIASEDQAQDDYKIQNSLVIKVPVAQFDDALSGLNNGIITITQKKVSSQDVTAEMVDTRSRLESKKKVHKRYTELLSSAKNMEEMFAIEREVNQIQENIEAADGRLNYLGHAAAYSTINLTYFQMLNPVMKENDSPGFGTKLRESFASGWHWIGGILLGLISIWPFLVLVIFLYWFLRKKLGRVAESKDQN